MKNDLFAWLLKAARWRLFRPLTTLFTKYMDAFLPVDRLTENDHWLAFHQPQPDYALHILIVPKTRLASMDAATDQPVEFHQDFYRVVNALIADFDLNAYGYRLISNGGPNQQVPQWHWHLISDYVQETHD